MPCASSGVRCPGAGGRGGCWPTSSIHWPVREQRVRLRVVRLPQRPPVGRDREAADADLVADEPWRDRDGCAGEHERGDERGRARARQAPGEVERAEHRDEDEPRVAEHREAADDAEQRREPLRRPLGDERASAARAPPRTTWSTISRLTCTSCQTRYGFSVAIAAATSPARGADDAAADLVDEQRGHDREHDLRERRSTSQLRPKIQ